MKMKYLFLVKKEKKTFHYGPVDLSTFIKFIFVSHGLILQSMNDQKHKFHSKI